MRIDLNNLLSGVETKLDINYVEDRNLWIDIKLIFKTVGVLFGDKNAH